MARGSDNTWHVVNGQKKVLGRSRLQTAIHDEHSAGEAGKRVLFRLYSIE